MGEAAADEVEVEEGKGEEVVAVVFLGCRGRKDEKGRVCGGGRENAQCAEGCEWPPLLPLARDRGLTEM